MNRARVERTIRQFFASPARRRGIAAVWLFGSVARRRTWRESDVDVAVLLQKDPTRRLSGYRFDLGFDLQAALGHPVDLVVLNRASAELVHQVLAAGRLLVDADPVVRAAFEVRKRNEYWDFKPYLDEYRRLVGSRR